MSNGDRNDLLRLGGQCPIGEDRLAERVESRLLIGASSLRLCAISGVEGE